MEAFKCYFCNFPWSLSSRGLYSLRYKWMDPSGGGGSVSAPHWTEDLVGPHPDLWHLLRHLPGTHRTPGHRSEPQLGQAQDTDDDASLWWVEFSMILSLILLHFCTCQVSHLSSWLFFFLLPLNIYLKKLKVILVYNFRIGCIIVTHVYIQIVSTWPAYSFIPGKSSGLYEKPESTKKQY